MTEEFEQYIIAKFPKSNLKASLFEVCADYELNISTWLGYDKHTQQEEEQISSLAIQIFEDLFLDETEPLWTLINHWDTLRDVYTFNQFKGLNNANHEAWISFDETQEVDREQILIETTLDHINYQNIIKTFIKRDYDHNPDNIVSRVFFINPRTNIYYLHFDSEVIIGSTAVSNLIKYYHKYYRNIERVPKMRFEKYIL